MATQAVKDKQRDEDIVMSLPAPLGELWNREPAVGAVRERSSQGQSGVHHNFEEILDVNFVDDGCYMIVHRQAAELVKRMRLLVRLDILKISFVGEHGQREDGGHVGAQGRECNG